MTLASITFLQHGDAHLSQLEKLSLLTSSLGNCLLSFCQLPNGELLRKSLKVPVKRCFKAKNLSLLVTYALTYAHFYLVGLCEHTQAFSGLAESAFTCQAISPALAPYKEIYFLNIATAHKATHSEKYS